MNQRITLYLLFIRYLILLTYKMIFTFPPIVSTLYSELLQQLESLEVSSEIGSLKGIFVSKKVNKKTYWYLQSTRLGKQYQVYMGAESANLLQLIKNHKEQKNSFRESVYRKQELCAMLQKGGFFHPDPISGRILELLTESGIFDLGGVLIGSYAFSLYGNMFGYRWEEKDHDLLHDESVTLAFDPLKINLPDILTQIERGFLPFPALNQKHPSTSFKFLNQKMCVDVLIPLIKKDKQRPAFIPKLNMVARPLRFLDYLIQYPAKAAVVHKNGLLVNVPHPARFAFHKLIVSQRRPQTYTLKIKKDLRQANLLFKVLFDFRPFEVKEAWKDLKKRGKEWMRYTGKGLKALSKIDPEIGKYLQKLTKLG